MTGDWATIVYTAPSNFEMVSLLFLSRMDEAGQSSNQSLFTSYAAVISKTIRSSQRKNSEFRRGGLVDHNFNSG
jgi:hypothetical protein